MNAGERRDELLGLYREFRDDSRALREKYERNQELFLEQALGRPGSRKGPRTGTPVLYATYRQELADAVEMMPEAVFLARRREDEGRASRLTALHRAVLERMDFARTYVRICEYRARLGVGFCETMVVRGEPKVVAYDPRAILTDPLCEDLQEGRAVFKVSYHTQAYYRAHYPSAFRRMRPDEEVLGVVPSNEKLSAMLTAYYKTYKGGRPAVHQMKIAGGVILYDSRQEHPQGLWEHGEYPFVAWYYDRLPGTPWGFGAFDYLAPLQRYIDKLDTLILQNLARGARPRLMVNRAAGLDIRALQDEEQEVVLADRIDESALRWQESAPLAPYAVEMLQRKCDMLKSESGQNAASRGELPSSSSSGTAISMLQAAGSKRTNLHQETINQAFLRMVRQVVSNLAAYGSRDASYRTPEGYAVLGSADAAGAWEFDLQVRLQQLPKYESVYQNQLLLQLLQMGVLPARTAFGLMDLSNKEAILKALEETEDQQKEETNGEDATRSGT
ncbi:MAG: portal protein [Candidatus Spyradocola sp.]